MSVSTRTLKTQWKNEAGELPKEAQKGYLAEMQGLMRIARLTQEGGADALDTITGITGSHTEINDSIDAAIKKSGQTPAKLSFQERLIQIKTQKTEVQCIAFKKMALELSDNLQKKSKGTLTKTDKDNFHAWFCGISQYFKKGFTGEKTRGESLPIYPERQLPFFR